MALRKAKAISVKTQADWRNHVADFVIWPKNPTIPVTGTTDPSVVIEIATSESLDHVLHKANYYIHPDKIGRAHV